MSHTIAYSPVIIQLLLEDDHVPLLESQLSRVLRIKVIESLTAGLSTLLSGGADRAVPEINSIFRLNQSLVRYHFVSLDDLQVFLVIIILALILISSFSVTVVKTVHMINWSSW